MEQGQLLRWTGARHRPRGQRVRQVHSRGIPGRHRRARRALDLAQIPLPEFEQASTHRNRRQDKRQMKLYAGRAIAAALAIEKSFYDIYEELTKYFPSDLAYRITERTKRGMVDTSKPGGITKGHHYISGLCKVKEYAKNSDMNLLYVGKISIDDIEEVRVLVEKGLLKPSKYLPQGI